jgi:hypothetical protein
MAAAIVREFVRLIAGPPRVNTSQRTVVFPVQGTTDGGFLLEPGNIALLPSQRASRNGLLQVVDELQAPECPGGTLLLDPRRWADIMDFNFGGFRPGLPRRDVAFLFRCSPWHEEPELLIDRTLRPEGPETGEVEAETIKRDALDVSSGGQDAPDDGRLRVLFQALRDESGPSGMDTSVVSHGLPYDPFIEAAKAHIREGTRP